MHFISGYEAPCATPEMALVVKTGDWRYQRPVTKAEKCAHCGTCYLYCPSGCVLDTGAYFAANLEYCKGCGVCASVCPSLAVMMVKEERE